MDSLDVVAAIWARTHQDVRIHPKLKQTCVHDGPLVASAAEDALVVLGSSLLKNIIYFY
jgi:hypothetical protein